ncbi:hypothetical protein [Taibaiella helva]|uniref:hypothetical protein n=1 Tax=Taibaiella helva TaxID=2301235 RepID=UPI001E4F075F|nr:hypothetical protein [Taibaiella helva]
MILEQQVRRQQKQHHCKGNKGADRNQHPAFFLAVGVPLLKGLQCRNTTKQDESLANNGNIQEGSYEAELLEIVFKDIGAEIIYKGADQIAGKNNYSCFYRLSKNQAHK